MPTIFLLQCLVFLLFSLESLAQGTRPNLATRRNADQFYGKEKIKISSKQLLILTSNNADAYSEAKAAKTYKNIGSVIGFTGGFLVGYGIAASLSGESSIGPLIPIGRVFIIGSILFQIGYATHARRAINIYHHDSNKIGQNKFEVNICMALNEMGVNIAF